MLLGHQRWSQWLRQAGYPQKKKEWCQSRAPRSCKYWGIIEGHSLFAFENTIERRWFMKCFVDALLVEVFSGGHQYHLHLLLYLAK